MGTYPFAVSTALVNPMTTTGDMIDGGASGVPARLAIGTSGQVLTVSAGAPAWAAAASAVTDWINVTQAPYSADNTGTNDATTAINNALAAAVTAGGGVVYFPAGTYKISSVLSITGHNVTMLGDGAGDNFSGNLTIIHQTSTTANGLTCADAAYINISGIAFTGPGSGSGKGIALNSSSPPGVFNSLTDVFIGAFGSDGLNVAETIMSTFTRVWSANNGGWGFNINSSAAGTSCTFSSCWARNNAGGGWQAAGNYLSWEGCGADINTGVGWKLNGCQSCNISGCGSEGNSTNAFWITNSSFAVVISGLWVSNHAIGLLIDASCFRITVAGFIETALSGATHGIQVGAGGIATLLQPQTASGVNIVSGGAFVNQIQDNGIALQGVPIPIQQATTGAAGYALVNGVGTVITWTAPNDGLIHRAFVWVVKLVTSNETGGQMVLNYVLPNGQTVSYVIDSGSNNTGPVTQYAQPWNLLIEAGSTVTVRQNSALTGGASVQWAEIWGS